LPNSVQQKTRGACATTRVCCLGHCCDSGAVSPRCCRLRIQTSALKTVSRAVRGRYTDDECRAIESMR